MITQPDNKATKIRLSVMPRCRLYYAKITQIIGLTKSMQCFLKICQKWTSEATPLIYMPRIKIFA